MGRARGSTTARGSRSRSATDQPGVATTVALPNGVTAWLEIKNPSPLASVHLMPAVDEAQVNGPRVIDWPEANVGVFSPALDRPFSPVHSLSVLSVIRVTDLG